VPTNLNEEHSILGKGRKVPSVRKVELPLLTTRKATHAQVPSNMSKEHSTPGMTYHKKGYTRASFITLERGAFDPRKGAGRYLITPNS